MVRAAPTRSRPVRHRGVPTREQRWAEGKAARRRVPRSSHASWAPPKDRPDPLDLLAEADRSRLPALLPIRYGRMSLSPFAFLRGAAPVMAHDLASTPRTGFRVQLCGDAHLSNFGMFGTPEREKVFDVNDFDETLPGPWEWDLKRLATSFILVGRQKGYGRSLTRRVARVAVRAYRRTMTKFARMPYSAIWYFHLDPDAHGVPAGAASVRLLHRSARLARRSTSLHVFPRIARAVRGGYRIRDQRPLIVHYRGSDEVEESRSFFDRYLGTLPEERRMLLDRYHIVDVAQKVVGVGSVGLASSVLLLLGDTEEADPLFLQMKQAVPSALEGPLPRSRYPNHAQRVVVGQHLIQQASDVFLGWSRYRSRDFYVRQLHDMKFAFDLSDLGPREFGGQAQLCGIALARAHARTGDPAGIGGYVGDGKVFDEAIVVFAEAYAEQTQQDHRALVAAIRSGRVEARVDV
jgi:uncharacterized protein (DUF2252 family)